MAAVLLQLAALGSATASPEGTQVVVGGDGDSIAAAVLPGGPAPPLNFSWATLPKFWQGHATELRTKVFTKGKLTGFVWNATMIEAAARFDLVVLNGGTAAQNWSDATMVEACREIKRIDASTSCVKYWGTQVVTLHTERGAELVGARSDWQLKNSSGGAVPWKGMGGVTPDYRIKEAADWWLGGCLAALEQSDGALDGCNLDNCQNFWRPYYPSMLSSGLSMQEMQAYADAKRAALQRLSLRVDNRWALFTHCEGCLGMPSKPCGPAHNETCQLAAGMNAQTFQDFFPSTEFVDGLTKVARAGKYFKVYTGPGGVTVLDCTNDDFRGALFAAFLVSAGPHFYYMCAPVDADPSSSAVWHPEFGYPLGPPKGTAVHIPSHPTQGEPVLRREFGSGTVALFQGMAGNVTGLGVGCVRWSNGFVTGTCPDVSPVPVVRSIPPGDPYPALHGGAFTGKRVAASPDPVHNYVWDLKTLRNPDSYQTISDHPVQVILQAGAPSDFTDLESLTEPVGRVTVSGPGLVRLKFAQEGACWVQFESADLAASGASVTLTISENKLPAPKETHPPVQHGPGTWRLEPNPQLYEGIRYAFLNVTAGSPDTGAAAFKPFMITQFRRGCQVVPTNYNGHFQSSDLDIDRIWWVGAYTVRVTLCGVGLGGGDRNQAPGVFLGSELMDRGDRVAFLGDAHVAQATATVAFGNYKVLAKSNNYTKSLTHDSSIEPYWMMWVLSCLDYWDATADKAAMQELVPWIVQRLAHAQVVYMQAVNNTASLHWSRDDDRMGFGFEFCDTPQAQKAFRALTIEACTRFAKAMRQLGNHSAAEEYSSLAAGYIKELRANPQWYRSWGMHSLGDAINAGFMSPTEIRAAVAQSLSDPLQLPSLSNFESFFVLRALARANESALAMGLVRRHWSYITKLNATTTWERFDPQHLDCGAMSVDSPPVNVMNDRTSMSHPWASGATSFLSRAGLGIVPTLPGYSTWDALPLLLGETGSTLLRSVQGRVPTPAGAIALAIDLDAGTCNVTVPATTVGRIGLPKLSAGLASVQLIAAPGMLRSEAAALTLLSNGTNRARMDKDVAAAAAQFGLATGSDERFWLLSGLREGIYYFRFVHIVSGTDHQAESPPAFRFAASFNGIDTETQGAWVGKYGSQGFYIFNASEQATDLVKLPKWVRNVWAPSKEDSTDPVTRGGAPPFANARSECPQPFDPDDLKLSNGLKAGVPEVRKLCVWVWNQTSPDDPRVPVMPPEEVRSSTRTRFARRGGKARVQAAAVSSLSWGGSFHIDIQAAAHTASRNITLYVVDFQRWGASQVVKAMDLTSLQTIAPMAFVTPDAFNGGAFIRYSYTGGIRFRLEQVHNLKSDRRGFPPRSMISAVFFD